MNNLYYLIDGERSENGDSKEFCVYKNIEPNQSEKICKKFTCWQNLIFEINERYRGVYTADKFIESGVRRIPVFNPYNMYWQDQYGRDLYYTSFYLHQDDSSYFWKNEGWFWIPLFLNENKYQKFKILIKVRYIVNPFNREDCLLEYINYSVKDRG